MADESISPRAPRGESASAVVTTSPAKPPGQATEASPAKALMPPGAPSECPDELMQAIASEHGDTIQCSKCGEVVAIDDLEPSSKDKYMVGKKGALIERICGLNYKCLARRWNDNSMLKVWWSQKDEAAKQQWYKEHKALRNKPSGVGGAGNSRVDFGIVEEEIRSTGIDRKRRRMWKSQALWERDRCVEDPSFAQKSRAARDQAWNQALLSEDIVKTQIDGAWHIGECQGMIEDVVDSHRTSASKQQRRQVSTLADAHLGQAGRRLHLGEGAGALRELVGHRSSSPPFDEPSGPLGGRSGLVLWVGAKGHANSAIWALWEARGAECPRPPVS